MSPNAAKAALSNIEILMALINLHAPFLFMRVSPSMHTGDTSRGKLSVEIRQMEFQGAILLRQELAHLSCPLHRTSPFCSRPGMTAIQLRSINWYQSSTTNCVASLRTTCGE